jgi:transcriptional regulator with XRE-family HTH domain
VKPVHPVVAALRQERQNQGLTLRELAAKADVSRSAIETCENGKHAPLLPILALWAAGLGFELTLKPIAGPDARPDGDVAPCGTADAYRRHVIRGEEPCPECWRTRLREAS